MNQEDDQEEHPEREVCDACGQSINYRSAVGRGIVEALKSMSKFIEKKGINAVHLHKELVIEKVWTEMQERNMTVHGVRLGLVFHIEDEVGNYGLTTKAMQFLAGENIPKYAYVKKRTEEQGSHTFGVSKQTCNVKDFTKKDAYWEVPGFEIQEGRVITRSTIKQ